MPVKQILLLWSLLALVVGCATSPLGRSQLSLMPAAQMDAMGVEAFNTLKKETPVEKDSRINNYIACISDPITAESGGKWELVVFQDDDPNAFALPGGKIGVHTGLMKIAENQSQMATVIGHEVAHVLSNHGNERVSQQFAVQLGVQLVQAVAQPESETGQALMGLLGVGAQFGILLPFSRVQESEADMLGLDLMAKAGFDPRQSVNLWQNMSKASDGSPPEFLSTHPSHSTRIRDLQNRMLLATHYQDQAKSAGKNPRCSL